MMDSGREGLLLQLLLLSMKREFLQLYLARHSKRARMTCDSGGMAMGWRCNKLSNNIKHILINSYYIYFQIEQTVL